jgi:hypothetical protein
VQVVAAAAVQQSITVVFREMQALRAQEAMQEGQEQQEGDILATNIQIMVAAVVVERAVGREDLQEA